MGDFKSYKEDSKKNYGTYSDALTLEQINTGVLMRIADSVEKMEQPYLRLIREMEYYRDQTKKLKYENDFLKNSNRGLKSYITRIKNK